MAAIRAAGRGALPRLQTVVRGDPKAKEAIYFVHGWPDNGQTFAPLFDRASKVVKADEDLSKYRCVLVSLPVEQFDEGVWNPEVLTFPVVISLLADLIRTAEAAPITLVGHDWGAVICSALAREHPDLLNRLVLMDIGAQSHPLKNPLLLVGIATYQIINACIYLIGRIPFLRGLADTVNAIWLWLLLAKLGGEPSYGPCRRSSGNFYYRHVFSYIASGGLDQALRYIKKPPPTLPLLFLYGTGVFHDKQWEARLQSDELPLCDAAFVAKCHWFHHREPATVARLIASWLSKVAKVSKGQ